MTIHIACGSDGEYAPHSAAMLHSVLTHTDGASVAIHYVHPTRFPSRFKRRVGRVVEEAGAAVEFHEVSASMVGDLPSRSYLSVATWFTLFAPSLIDADRILWLDADTIVLDDLAPLASIDVEGAWVAAAEDMLARFGRHLPILGIDRSVGYFNAGVMVLDLDALRRDGKHTELIREGHRLAPWFTFADQDALNVVLGARRKRLHPRWNVTPAVLNPSNDGLIFDKADANEARERPAIRHFFGPNKPWSDTKRPADSALYWEHRRAVPFPGGRGGG